jgi:hypothetical protein
LGGVSIDQARAQAGGKMSISRFWKSISGASADPSAPRELRGASEGALSQSLRTLASGDRGWIELRDAQRLFSAQDPQYAFGEMDDDGRNRLARFGEQHGVSFDIMPVEGRIYFSRRS